MPFHNYFNFKKLKSFQDRMGESDSWETYGESLADASKEIIFRSDLNKGSTEKK